MEFRRKNELNKKINYIQEVNKHVSITEGEIALENLLIQVFLNDGISNKKLAKELLLPIPLVTAAKKEYMRFGLMEQKGGVRITNKGVRYIENELGFKGLNKHLYLELTNNTIEIDQIFKDDISSIVKIFDNRPSADVKMDQTHCTFETSLQRAILAIQKQSVIGKKILCLGDDDLVSVSIGLILKKLFKNDIYSQTEIHVIDLDERVLDYIRVIAEKYCLPIKCHQVDVRNPLNDKFLNEFDCFFTDPPYTLNGMNLFLSRGISALKRRKGLSIFLSFAHKSFDYSYEMIQQFVKMGLSIDEIRTNFNSYHGAGIIGNSSQLILLRTTRYTKPCIHEKDRYDNYIYTGELRKAEKLYKCKNCGEKYLIGYNKNVSTIEELKGLGCNRCNGKSFIMLEKNNIVSRNRRGNPRSVKM